MIHISEADFKCGIISFYVIYYQMRMHCDRADIPVPTEFI